MKKFISIALCLLLIVSCTLPVMAASDVPQEVMEATKSVVRILSRYSRSSSTGSGFVIKNDGEEVLIATNNHVVEGNPLSIAVWVAEDELVDAEIVFTTARKDLCVLRLKGNVDMKPLTMATEAARQGQAVYAVGYPAVGDVLSDSDAHTSEAATITDGIISAIRTFTIEEGADPAKLLQINAAINPGNSGGPLFNAAGEVIGVNTYKVNMESQGIFGAVEISELWMLLEQNQIEIPSEETVPETEVPKAASEEGKPFPVGILAVCLAMAVLAVAALFVFRKKDRNQTGKPGKRAVTLREYMETHPQGLGVGGVVSLLLPAAVQLRNLHNDGKLHLEVCPEKIRIGEEGAFLKEPSGQETGRFNNGFAAPEIYRGAGFGITSDVYSFAALLFYAATGRECANSLQREALEQDLALLDNVDFAHILRRAMASGTADRTQSMQELIYSVAVYNAPVQEQQPAKTAAAVTEKPVPLREEKQTASPENVIANQSADWRGDRRECLRCNPSSKHKIPVILTAVLACVLLSVFLLWKPDSRTEEITLEAPQETNQETTPQSILETTPETMDPLSPEALAYAEAEKLLADGEAARAAIAFGKLGDYSDARERSFACWRTQPNYDTICASGSNTTAIRKDGTVNTVGEVFGHWYNSENWCVTAISAKGAHILGLKSDGTVISEGWNDRGQREVDDWCDICVISSGRAHSVGVKADGTVVHAGNDKYDECNVDFWRNIVKVSASGEHTVGLKNDGTVVASGQNYHGQCDVKSWSDIVAVSASAHTVGLKADGSVIAVGLNNHGQCMVDDWTDIIAVSAGYQHTVGLKADGTVVAAGENADGQCDVDEWTDVVAISAGAGTTVGLKADGTVVAVGNKNYGKCNVEEWTDIKLPTTASISKPRPKAEEPSGLPASMSMSVRNAEDNAGVYVVSVDKGKAAQRASIAAGDIITRLDDYPIANVTDLNRALRSFKAGDVAYVTLLREETELEFAIIFDAKP